MQAATKDLSLHIARFVDDLRLVNGHNVPLDNDEQALHTQLMYVKYTLEQMGGADPFQTRKTHIANSAG